jgi:Cof subfamily protein (haloacid dehalogenase superfamily)
MEYKLLVVDVDGTLVNGNGLISAEDEKAIIKAAASGLKISLSTGRVIKACRKIIDRLELNGHHIFFDGALVSDPSKREEIYSQPLKKEAVRQAVEFAHPQDIYLELYSAENFFAQRENWSDDVHRRFFGVEPTIVDFSGIWQRERIIKAELVVHNSEERRKAEIFEKEFSGRLRFSIARSPGYPGIDFINIIDPEVSKGKALMALALHLGIKIGEVMAIGDGLNDISLLEIAGLAVAMGNAPEEVKKIADHVTLDVDHSGVAAAIERFII